MFNVGVAHLLILLLHCENLRTTFFDGAEFNLLVVKPCGLRLSNNSSPKSDMSSVIFAHKKMKSYKNRMNFASSHTSLGSTRSQNLSRMRM